MRSLYKSLLKKFTDRLSNSRSALTSIQKESNNNLAEPGSREFLLQAYKSNHLYSDFTDKELAIINMVRKETMTSPERIVSLIHAVKYIVNNNIPGDFVECGVWRGGSMMVVAYILSSMGVDNRNLYLYDTFSGMSAPTMEDISYNNVLAEKLLEQAEKSNEHSIWCYSTLDTVKQNLKKTGYEVSKIFYVKGKVENTIPATIPDSIALLRLDTDWFESTYHELLHLYPLLTNKGLLIIDDYGHWKGAKAAVDKYFSERNAFPLLHRIDYTGRMIQKF